MKHVDGWWFPDREQHLIAWMASPKGRMILNGRPAYQGRKQTAVLKCFPQGLKNKVAVDVGAHIGLWTYNLAAWGCCEIHSFEPVAEHRACFEKNVTAPSVRLYPYALGHEEGSVKIAFSETSTGDSWVDGKGDIPLKTLDSFKLKDVAFVKIDTEGYEENVLKGGLETIQASRPVICVEQKRQMASKFGLKPQGAVEFLKQLGYVVREEISGDYIMVPTCG